MEQHPLSGMKTTKPIVLSGESLSHFVHYFAVLFYPSVFLFYWIFFVFWKLLTSLFYALVGLAIGVLLLNVDMNFESLYKLAAYAQTASSILSALMTTHSNWHMSLLTLLPICFFLTSLYMALAICEFRQPAPAPAAPTAPPAV
jgi:hypothetical protein